VNANLKPTDRVYFHHREFRYYLNVPSYFGSWFQAIVELRPELTDVRTLYRQLRRFGITHLMLAAHEKPGEPIYDPPLDRLAAAGCVERIKRFEVFSQRSRTMPTLISNPVTLDVLKLKDENCLP
jgi:hypothetical protein